MRVLGETVLGSPTTAAAAELARHESMPLTDLLVPFLKLSNNGHGEALTKAIGRAEAGEGSWSAGLAAIGDYLAGHGLDVDAHRQADGSGLSRWNLVPADQFVTLLRALRDEEWFDAWYEALPVAGGPDRIVVALAEFTVDGAGTMSTWLPEPAALSPADDLECSWLKPARC